MAYILGIETSCDETAAALFDSRKQHLLSSVVFSQVDLHEQYGGVVPEIASRSHLEKIGSIVQKGLQDASLDLDQIDSIAVTTKPGLVGSLLIGLSFAKGLAWAKGKNLIGIDHLEGHIFSPFISMDGSIRSDIKFPHISFVVSGGHTGLYLVRDFGSYELLGRTLDDAAGEAFDKVAKLLGLGYPGGPVVERLASEVAFEDFFKYPRTKNKSKSFDFSFSGLKTAVLYDLVKRGAYDLKKGIISEVVTTELQQKVSSSLIASITDIFIAKLKYAFTLYPDVKCVTFAGGVACNKYLRSRLGKYCASRGKMFAVPPIRFCSDNAAMIAFVGGYKDAKNEYGDQSIDVLK
jgi:N6-L-threonylcarbamoyladenine synthase